MFHVVERINDGDDDDNDDDDDDYIEAQIPSRRLLRNFHGRGSFGEVGVMEFGSKGTSRVCRGRHGEVGIVEFGLNCDSDDAYS